jgi:ABC-2 type transport system permease protein
MNLATAAVTVLSMLAVGVKANAGTITLLFVSYFVMQIEIAAITFAVSAFIRKAGLGIGLGLAAVFYFINIMAGLTEKAEFLRYLTPFGYTNGADIVSEKMIDPVMLAIGITVAAVSVAIAYYKYNRKDIAG